MMVLFLGILLLIGFFGTSIVSYLMSRHSIRDLILNHELPLTSDNIYSEIQRDLLQPIFISSLMSNDTFLKDWIVNGEKDIDKITQYLSEIKKRYNTVATFFVSEKTRNYYYAEGILKQVDPKEPRDAWYFRVKEMDAPYEINVDPDMANKDAMTIFINYKVFDQTGNFLGATGVGLTVNMVKKLIANYRTRYDRNIYFFNNKGKLVLNSVNKGSAANEVDHVSDLPALKHFASQIIEGRLKNFEASQTNSNALINVRYIPDLNWLLVVEQPEDNTGSLFMKNLLLNLTVCFLISVAVLGIIRITIIRYQENLEVRNQELEVKNLQISEQRTQLERQTKLLKEANSQLELLNEEKDEIIGITAHDLKSPMNAIVGFAELIGHNPDNDEETQRSVEYILESANKMVDRINSLLDVGESTFDLKLKPFDFRESVNRSIHDYRFQTQFKSIELITDFPEEPLMTLANEKWMAGIVDNLISNAIKYSPENSTVTLKLGRENGHVRFEVIDQGAGIPEEDLPSLFKKFSKATPTPTAGEESTGLGLYIVQTMAQRMGGKVWCETEVGKGSRFIVEFPAA